jgi:hypothetical protein
LARINIRDYDCIDLLNRFALANHARLFHRFAMHSYELLREVFEKKPPNRSPPTSACRSRWFINGPNRRITPPAAAPSNPLDRIEALLTSTGDHRLVQWICQRAGGFFIQNPKHTPHPHFLIPATNQIVQEFADLLHVIAAATADEKITQAEAKEIRARWEELKTVTEGFVACCEEGNFSHLRNHAAKRAASDQPPG